MKESRGMEILLVTGFLGAGKTTLIKHLLTSQTEGIGKVAVIVNEVGDVGIDGTLLSGRDVDIVELSSGCICCTIKTDFLKAIQEINDRVDPDFLFVETTGVAQPLDILNILLDLPLSQFCRLRSLVTVVDAGFFKVRELLGPFYDNQIQCADIIILNKVDQVEAGLLGEIEELLREMNQGVMLLPAQYCVVDPSLLIHGDSDSGNGHLYDPGDQHNHREWGFQTFSFEHENSMDRDRLVEFLNSLPSTLFRLKGWIRFPESSAHLDFTGGRYNLEPIDSSRNTSLAFVGRNCNEKKLLSALHSCLIKEQSDP